jgi:hypothetical protein
MALLRNVWLQYKHDMKPDTLDDRLGSIVLKNSVFGRSVKISASMGSFILSDMRAHIKLLTNRLRATRSLTHESCIALPKNMD